MNDIAIRVENLCKQFHIGALQKNRNFREVVIDGLRAPFRRTANLLRGHSRGAADLDETIWALKDVSFDIRRGEAVGIIGGNGAGKSTLLKIISRITEPSGGFAEVRGRVGSLLEVGTGFHHELSGRENIFLNGAILGMRREEIKKNFDEIVDFAEVGKFIDTPVKQYSSGMYLRLAFAVAAYLEPDTLIVDEVLAVGDMRFQKKCLNKMQDVGREGRTVLFVSHSMEAISRLCERSILLKDGKVIMDGNTPNVVNRYLDEGIGLKPVRKWNGQDIMPGDEVVRLCAVQVTNEDGKVAESVDIRDPFCIQMEFEVFKPGHWLLPNFNIYNDNGMWIFTSLDQDPVWRKRGRPAGRYKSTCWVPGNLLASGLHFIEPAMMTPEPFARRFRERNAVAIQIVDTMEGNSARGDWMGIMGGAVRPLLKWTTECS